jgi:beta-galactosidase GanA
VKTWVDWSSAEPVQGQYNFDALVQLLQLANSTGLRVIIQVCIHACLSISLVTHLSRSR